MFSASLRQNPQFLLRQSRLMSSKVLVQLKNADVHRFGVQKPAFKDLSLSFKNTERWVIVGPVSAGKSTLAEVKHATKWIE